MTIIGASMSEPLPSDVNVDFVCLSVCHGPAYGVRTARQRRMRLIFARGSVCYYGYSLSSEHSIDNTYSTHLRGT